MKINRIKLSNALKIVSPAVVGTSEDLTGSFIFSKGRVFTFNNELAVSTPIDVGFTGAIPAKKFEAFVNKVKTEDIDLVVKGGEVFLSSSKAKAGLRLEESFTLPLEDVGMPAEWFSLPVSFKDAVSLCLFSVGKDYSKEILTNIHIKDNYVESCDNYRATRYILDFETGEMLIPAVSAKVICSGNPLKYAIADGWLHFKNAEDVTFSCRCGAGGYPDLSNFVSSEGEPFDFPEDVAEMMDRAETMSDGERASVFLEDGELIISTENNGDWFEESSKIKYDGKPFEFDIQPKFLKAIVKYKGEVSLCEKVLKFETDVFTHVAQLLTKKGA